MSMIHIPSPVQGTITTTVVMLLLVLGISAGAMYFFYCPCDRLPGGWLLGEEVSTPINDWSFANEAGLCQVQVATPLPHSINLNCMSADGVLYLSCMGCADKTWSNAAIERPNGRIRIGERVYAVVFTRVTDQAVLDRAWRARATKTGSDNKRPEHWWSFEVRSNTNS
ncbi:MAG: hypothetical protein O3A63_20790 [Proteobacteria bacterium]|nr:hypothetical protein [Pseudomonadota bacterium]